MNQLNFINNIAIVNRNFNYIDWFYFELKPCMPLSNIAIELLVNNFYNDILDNLPLELKDKKFRVQLIFKSGEDYKSISHIQILDTSINSKQKLINVLLQGFNVRSERYFDLEIDNLFLRFKFISDPSVNIKVNEDFKDIIPVDSKIIEETNLHIPISFNIEDWSSNIQTINDNVSIFTDNNYHYSFNKINDNKHEVVISTLSLDKIIKFTDARNLSVNNPNSFTREWNLQTREYVNGSLLSVIENDTKFISKVKKENKFDFKALTMDLETRLDSNNTMSVVSAVILDNVDNLKNDKTFFITDFKDSEDLLISAIKYLLQPKFDGYHIYLHNLSSFDGIFLLKIIANVVDSNNINLLYKDRDIISIGVKFTYKKLDENGILKTFTGKVEFNDSILLLPASLAKLAKGFNVINKGSFDFSIINNTPINQLNTIREDLLKYNKQDCLVLYQIMEKFGKEIYNLFNLNINKYPTLSSLSMAILRNNYMSKVNIPISNLNFYNYVSKGYRGGHVDVYKPYAENINVYDANSLYSAMMMLNKYPVGNPIRFFSVNGNHMFSNLENIFGFVLVKVYCPIDMKIPILLYKMDNGKTVAPVGTWIGVYFSEELKYAQSLGYKFEIIDGIHFENREVIFDKFVNSIYDIRLQHPNKDDPKNLIAKLILNSPYGRFGMSPYLEAFEIVNKDNSDLANYFDSIDLGDKELISYPLIKNVNNKGQMMNISIFIAAAVTSYARIHMHIFKMIAGDSLCYGEEYLITYLLSLNFH